MLNTEITELDKTLLTILLSLLSITGTIGNILVLMVYNKKNAKLSQKTFINALAIMDLFVCVSVIPYSIFLERRVIRNHVLCHVMEFVRTYSVVAANVSLVTIAAERYIAVSRPMKTMSSRTKRLVLTIVLILCVPISIPGGLTFTVIENVESACVAKTIASLNGHAGPLATPAPPRNCSPEQVVEKYCYYTTAYLTPPGADAYKMIQTGVFITGILLMIVFYVSVYRILHKRAKARQEQFRHIVKRVAESKSAVLTSDISEQRLHVRKVKPFSNGECPDVDKNNTEGEQVTSETEISLTKSVIRNVGLRESRDCVCVHSELDNVSTRSASVSKTEAIIVPQDLSQVSTSHTAFDQDSEVTCVNKTIQSSNLTNQNEGSFRVFARSAKHPIAIKNQSTGSTRPTAQRKTTTMLFVCTVIFVVSWIPFWVDVFNITNSRTFRYLFLLGHATNPIVYGIVNADVRKAVVEIMRCRCLKVYN